jgi:hypothetical protein
VCAWVYVSVCGCVGVWVCMRVCLSEAPQQGRAG